MLYFPTLANLQRQLPHVYIHAPHCKHSCGARTKCGSAKYEGEDRRPSMRACDREIKVMDKTDVAPLQQLLWTESSLRRFLQIILIRGGYETLHVSAAAVTGYPLKTDPLRSPESGCADLTEGEDNMSYHISVFITTRLSSYFISN